MGTRKLISFEEFERLDFGTDKLELLQGEVIGLAPPDVAGRVPPPERKHVETCERLFILLKAALERWKLSNSESATGKLHIKMGYLISSDPPSWLRPEVSLTHPNQPGDRYYEGAPLVAFEVVSEHDMAAQLEAKVADYLANGAAEVWVIYPETRRAWVYRGTAQGATRETEAIHSDLLPGIEIRLDEIL